jgi:hypothetical protein
MMRVRFYGASERAERLHSGNIQMSNGIDDSGMKQEIQNKLLVQILCNVVSPLRLKDAK